MTMAQLLRLTESGEDSTLEFTPDGIADHQLAKELVAFLNLEGGTLNAEKNVVARRTDALP